MIGAAHIVTSDDGVLGFLVAAAPPLPRIKPNSTPLVRAAVSVRPCRGSRTLSRPLHRLSAPILTAQGMEARRRLVITSA